MAVLDAPQEIYAPKTGGPKAVSPRRTRVAPRRVPRDFDEDFAADFDEAEGEERPGGGLRVRLKLGALRTRIGWILLASTILLLSALGTAAYMAVRKMVLADDRFVIPSSSAMEIQGNQHLTRAQLLSIFGGDIERNIFLVSLADRRTELEQLPWVQHATVMRLLPDHLRVAIVERTPVAFTRQGGQIGLVDAEGVLLDMPPEGGAKYSFPVITGLAASDPLSTRTARMKIYKGFVEDIDSEGDKISAKLSEVDLSNPEDVKALIPENGAEILVHFGDADFLTRYKRFEEMLPTWRSQYPKLASVDMRYDRQAVLEMQPGTAVPVAGVAPSESSAPVEKDAVDDSGRAASPTVSTKVPAVSGRKPAVSSWKRAKTASAAAKSKAAHGSGMKPKTHGAQGKAKATPARAGSSARTATKYHPGQAVQR